MLTTQSRKSLAKGPPLHALTGEVEGSKPAGKPRLSDTWAGHIGMHDRMGKSSKKEGRKRKSVGQLVLADLHQYLQTKPSGLAQPWGPRLRGRFAFVTMMDHVRPKARLIWF